MRVVTSLIAAESVFLRALGVVILAALGLGLMAFFYLGRGEGTVNASPDSVGPRMEKDANVMVQGVQTTSNLWLMDPDLGCVCAPEGKGCATIDNWLFNVQDNEGLGSWEEQIRFDSTLVQVTPVPDNTWLEAFGRIANCSVTVIDDNTVLAGCTTTDDPAVPGTQLGPNGDGLIQHIHVVPKTNELTTSGGLRPTRGNGITTDIVDEDCKVADALGEQIPDTLPGGYTGTCGDAQLRLRVLEGDLNLDCIVNVLDLQMIAFRFGSVIGEPTYDVWYDIEPDTPNGEIDTLDLQSVFGRAYSTCQVPIPEYQAQPEQPPPRPTAPPDATVETEVVSDGLEVGTEVVVVVRAYNMPSVGVGAIETSWTYDPEVIQGSSIYPDVTDLESTGRIANCVPHLEFAGASRRACLTISSVPGMQPGPAGTVVLPYHFERLRSGPTGINLERVLVADPLGNELYPHDTASVAVGGIQALPDVSQEPHSGEGLSFRGYAIVVGVAAAVVVVTGSACYARRRRWLR